MDKMHWTALLTLGVLALGFAVTAIAGRARVKYAIKAPATTGHEMFERAYRVQMNTLETTVLFLPALWLAAYYVGALFSTAVGAVWLVARVWYAAAYLRDPRKRGPAFGLAYAAWGVLMFGSAWSVLTRLCGY
jgi:uncharacterized MAPEG superfamily protein